MTKKSSNFKKYTSRNLLKRWLITSYQRQVIKLIDLVSPQKILDVGCGEGFLEKALLARRSKGLKIVAVDKDPQVLKVAKKNVRQGVKFSQGDIYQLSFPDASFDLVLALEILEHLGNPGLALQELLRVTESFLILSVPNEPLFSIASFLSGSYWKTWGRHPEHKNFWNKHQFCQFLKKEEVLAERILTPFPWIVVLGKKK